MAELRKAPEKKVILAGNTKSFMVNSVIKGLNSAGFEVIPKYASIEAASDAPESVKTYVLFMDDNVTEEFLVYLRDEIDDKDISLFVIGNPAELDLCYKTIPEVKIEESFKRPLNISDLAYSLEKIIEEQTSRSSKKKIPVVDDDGTMLRTIKTWLEKNIMCTWPIQELMPLLFWRRILWIWSYWIMKCRWQMDLLFLE
jgi:hypothetical protein